ncbi:MAG TPA: GAF domain-containing protein [Burkholderiales bacterium]|nr:GAF domain-containing protein [Burkholderiales bacterium]
MTLSIDSIRDCLEGAIPAMVATCAADGTPNVSFVSQVHYVDDAHVALSFQFFNKTRENVLANPRAAVAVIDPRSAAHYRLALEYLRTETEGPLFERMKAKLAGIASHSGMSGVFRLRGSDVYRVLGIERVPGREMPAPPRRNLLAALRSCSERLARCADLGRLIDELLACLDEVFGIGHSMVLVPDGAGARLYTVASRGYPASGVGSEIPLGCGVIGVAARERTPIRISHMTSDYAYGQAVRERAAAEGLGDMLEIMIPLPGLAEARSQLALPVAAGERLLGVLYVESAEEMRFGYDDEDALVALATQTGMVARLLQDAAEAHDEAPAAVARAAPPDGTPVPVRHYAADGSVFIGDDYLIKGVAGAIFCKLLRDYGREGRTEFSNRELRLDPSIRLPDVSDNLEARLILLSRRLAERCEFLRIEKTGRGRFRLVVARPVRLIEMAA